MKSEIRIPKSEFRPMASLAVTAGFACACLCAVAAPARAEQGRSHEPAISAVGLVAPPSADVVRTRTLEWVAQRVAGDKSRLEEIGRLWALPDEAPVPEALFDLCIQSFALADEATGKL